MFTLSYTNKAQKVNKNAHPLSRMSVLNNYFYLVYFSALTIDFNLETSSA